jgi:arginase
MDFAPKIQARDVALIGIRSVDEGERVRIRQLQVMAYTMPDIDKHGAYDIIERVITHMRKHVDHLHVSFDLDVVDPLIVKGVGTPVAGGLSYREAHLIMEAIADSGLLSSLEVAEVNPILDDKNSSAVFAAEVVASTMGKHIL